MLVVTALEHCMLIIIKRQNQNFQRGNVWIICQWWGCAKVEGQKRCLYTLTDLEHIMIDTRNKRCETVKNMKEIQQRIHISC
jgi:hypothetical protein